MKIFLLFFFLSIILYAFMQRRHVRLLPWVLILLSTVCVYFVWLPEKATHVANMAGVGRGADLLLYLWFVVGSLVIFFLAVQIRKMHEDVTRLARELAIDRARINSGDPR